MGYGSVMAIASEAVNGLTAAGVTLKGDLFDDPVIGGRPDDTGIELDARPDHGAAAHGL